MEPIDAAQTTDAAASAAPVMPPEEASLWKARITASREFIKPVIAEGKRNVQRQRQKFFNAPSSVDRIAAPDDFFLSQQKIAKLFYKVPEVQLSGKTPDAEPVAPLFQAVLNEQLDAEHINVKATIDEMLTDLITAVGFGACKIGYNSVVIDVPSTDPMTGAPVIGPDGSPAMEKALIHEAYECSRIPPGRMLFCAEHIRSDFDTSPFLGFTFPEDVPEGTPYSKTTRLTDDEYLLSKTQSGVEGSSRTYLMVDAMWFKGSIFKPDVQDPEEIWEFEWVQGAPEPRKYRKCPYVKFPGFPVKVVTTRYISDSSLPPSDTTITRNIIDAKSIGLSTELVHRQRALPQNLMDTSRLDGDTLQKIEANVQDAFIGIGMPVTDDLVRPLVKGQLPQDHYVLQQTLDRMIAASWSMGSSQTGAKEQGTHTATELQIVEANMDTRLGYEEDKAAVFFLTKQVRCIAALLQQYAPQNGGYARVLDANGTARLQQWSASDIQGKDFAFKIKINSQSRPDSAADLKRTTDWVNYSAKSPFVNQQRNWTLAAEAFGFDPAQLIVTPPPPKPEPPPLSLKGDDLNPLMPQYANVYAIMEKFYGVQLPIPPPLPPPILGAGVPGNPLTPGTADEANVLTKHVDTGELPGGGSMVANQVQGLVPRALPQLDKSRLM